MPPRSASRRNTPVSPAKNARNVGGSQPTRRTTRSQSQEPISQSLKTNTAGKTLQTISERRRLRDEDVLDNSNPPHQDPEESELEDRSRASSSAGEGESERATALEALNREDLISNLETLYEDSNKILSALASSDSKSIHQTYDQCLIPGSAMNKKIQKLVDRFRMIRTEYGPEVFINVEHVIAKLSNNEPTHYKRNGPWRPDAILQYANLADFLATIYIQPQLGSRDIFQNAFNTFPRPMTAGLAGPLDGTDLIKETTLLSLDIRTQYFINNLESHDSRQSIDIYTSIRECFWDEENAPLGYDSIMDTYLDYSVMVSERADSIRKLISSESISDIDFQRLKKRFPFPKFVENLTQWSFLRKQEIESLLAERGGVSTIVDLLDSGDFTSFAEQKGKESAPQIDIPALVTPKSTKRLQTSKQLKDKDVGNIGRFKVIRSEKIRRESGRNGLRRSNIAPQSDNVDHEIMESPQRAHEKQNDPVQSNQGDSSQNQIVPTQQTAIVMEALNRPSQHSDEANTGQASPKRSFYDRQDNAERVQFDDTQTAEPRSPGRQMKPASGQSDVDDEEFEEDSRSPKRVRIEQTAPRPNYFTELANSGKLNVPTGENVELEENSETRPERATPTPEPQSSQRRRRLPFASPSKASAEPSRPRVSLSQEEDLDDLPPPSQHQVVNSMAKEAVRMAKELGYQNKGVQIRKGYSAEEVDRLMEMVALYGTAWSRIVAEDARHEDGPRLQQRTQVQLKDKARNIKLDYLKARKRLPEGFSTVSIGHRQIENLRSLGIDYIEGEGRGYDANDQG